MKKQLIRPLLVLLLALALLPLTAAALSAPAKVQAQGENAGVRVTWSAVSGASRYRVFRLDSRGRWVKLADTRERGYTDTTAQPGRSYTYALRCITKGGRCTSPYSSRVVFAYAKAPRLTALSCDVKGVKLTWTAQPGVRRYRVFRKTGRGGWQALGDTGGTVYTDTATVSGVGYTYTLRCLSADGKRYVSGYDTTGRSLTWLSPPVQKTPAIKGTTVTLRWDRVNGAAAYRVLRRSGTGWAAVGDTTGTSYIVTGLAEGQAYTFTVRCVSADGKRCTSAADPDGHSIMTGIRSPLVYIDPGHQQKGDADTEPIGPGAAVQKAKVTGGTSGVATGLAEHRLNLILSQKLGRALERRGYEVRYTRTTDNVNLSNRQRAALANRAGADAVLRIHANGSSDRSRQGMMTICPSGANAYVTPEVNRASLRLSRCVLTAMVQATGAESEGVRRRDDLTGLNWSQVPVTLIEVGYMTNPAEDRLLSTAAYQNKLVQGMADGVDAYFGKEQP